jgi:signal transduction histidine kinase
MAAAVLPIPLLAHLFLALPAGRLRTPRAKVVVAACYAVSAVVGLLRILVYKPFLDPNCWANCTTNVLLIAGRPAAAALLSQVQLAFTVVAGLVVGLAASARLLAATASGRRHTRTVLPPLAAVALAEVAYAAAALGHPHEEPAMPLFTSIFLARAAALSLLGIALLWAMLGDRRRTAQLARLGDDLANTPPPGALEATLASALDDPSLIIGYWLADAGHYADSSGIPIQPHPAGGLAVISIRRGGDPVAVIMHDRARTDPHRLEQALGPAARLAIDNERLHTSLHAQLSRSRAARARIVQAGDEARRRLEHDLHDGTQQQLTMLLHELLRASAHAADAGDIPLVQAAELRDIAHGLFPAILEGSGLGPALETVADQSAIPVHILTIPDERFPPPVERAVYLAVVCAIADATRDAEDAEDTGHAGHAGRRLSDVLTVAVTCTPDRVLAELTGVGARRNDQIEDRIGALGGTVTYQPPRLRLEIPCG